MFSTVLSTLNSRISLYNGLALLGDQGLAAGSTKIDLCARGHEDSSSMPVETRVFVQEVNNCMTSLFFLV